MATVSTAPASQANGSPDSAAAAHGLERGNGLIAGTVSPESVREFYAENGYYILPDALTAAEVEALRAETTAICKGERGDVDGFEPNVPGEDEDDVLRRYLCIHFPHKISEVMLGYLGHRHIAEVLTQVIGPNVKCMQSMLFHQGDGQAGAGVAPGRVFYPDARPDAYGGVDCAGRCDGGERVPVGHSGLA